MREVSRATGKENVLEHLITTGEQLVEKRMKIDEIYLGGDYQRRK